MSNKLFLFAWVAAALAACSSEDTPVPATQPRLLTVEVSENPLVDENGQAAPARRGAEITASTLTGFSMNYESTKYDVSKSGSTWINNPDAWPVPDDSKITFYAYNGGTFYSEGHYVSFTVDNTVSDQKDLLVATKSVAYNDASGKVWLTFDHACAAVNFNVQRTNTLGADVTVTSIRLEGVKNQGEYNYTAWSDLSGSGSYELLNSTMTVTTTPTATSNGTLFLIPQTLDASAKLVITYTKGTSKTAEISLKDITWAKGTKYTVNIKLGTKLIQ